MENKKNLRQRADEHILPIETPIASIETRVGVDIRKWPGMTFLKISDCSITYLHVLALTRTHRAYKEWIIFPSAQSLSIHVGLNDRI